MTSKNNFHHKKLPNYSTLLCGKLPPNKIGFKSKELQIWYNNTNKPWVDKTPHYHKKSDECFIVLKGSIVIEVGGKQTTIKEREFCYFPKGIIHSIIKVNAPVESFMIRSASINDKVYIKKG